MDICLFTEGVIHLCSTSGVKTDCLRDTKTPATETSWWNGLQHRKLLRKVRDEYGGWDMSWWYRRMEGARKTLSPPFKWQRHHIPHMLSRLHGNEIALSGSAAVWVAPPCCLCMSQRKDLEQTYCKEKDRAKTWSQAKSFKCLWSWTPASNTATAQIMRTSYQNTLPFYEIQLDHIFCI